MIIDAFPEGQTEVAVIEAICQRDKHQSRGNAIYCHPVRGKQGIRRTFLEIVPPKLPKRQPVRCLIFRDLDSHDGETIEIIEQSVTDMLKQAFRKMEFDESIIDLRRHPDHDNVFTVVSPQPDFRFALHVAEHRWKDDFIKSTIDDYVLSLALNAATAESMARKLGINGERLVHKITKELPDLLIQNGIPLKEAKDYVRLYAAVIKSHTSPPVFAGKTMANAEDDLLCEVFAPLKAALDFVRNDDHET